MDTSRRKKSRAVTSGVYSNTSMDMTLKSTKRRFQKSSKRAASGTLDDSKNVLLEDNTLPYLFSDGRGNDPNESMSSDAISNASLLFENSHTRWYHRCFKCNIALNIAMLITFILIIMMAPWYAIKYHPDADTKMWAQFSLLLISFSSHNETTGDKSYYRIFSVSFFSICDKCDHDDPAYAEECNQIGEFCGQTSQTLTNIVLYIVSTRTLY